jgi:hypothetical protein
MPSRLVVLFALVFVALGVALLVQTARAGGGIGYLLGVLFIGLGAGRLYLLRTRQGRS